MHRLIEADELQAVRAYWRFYRPIAAEVLAEVREEAKKKPALQAVIESDQAGPAQERERLAAIELAIEEGQWSPYNALLRQQGERHAETGVAYGAWFAIARMTRDGVRRRMLDFVAADTGPRRALMLEMARGMSVLTDYALARIGEAHFAAVERRTRRGEARYQAMFRDSPVPMFSYDLDTSRIVEINDAALRTYGYERAELVDVPVSVLLADGESSSIDGRGEVHRHRHKQGEPLLLEVSANDLDAVDRNLRLVSVNDVTARERAREALRKTEEQLHRAQKMDAFGRLAGGVAHDFNNILTVIESYAYMLDETFDATDPRKEDALEIQRAAERATALTRQLLALGRQSQVSPRTLSLDDVIQRFVPMLRRLLGEQVTIDLRSGDVPPVFADPGQIEQVVMNLAVNARDAMGGSGRLTIETSITEVGADEVSVLNPVAGRFSTITVTDTGSGIDEETQRKIFDPFFTTKEAGKGTGLGLSIVHGIVTQAGGLIDVYSELGHGTTFRVKLPVIDETVVVPVETPARAATSLPPVTVLVVDDKRELRTVVSRLLQEAGCQMLLAATCAEARNLCVSHEGAIHVVLSDLVLSDGRGDHLVHELREIRPELQVVLMSGYPATSITPSGHAPAVLLAKPFTPSKLREAVAAAVATGNGTARRSEPALQPRVLLVDDDANLRKMLGRLLRRAGFDVTDVDSGRKALAELEAKRYDVVLSDVHMPDGNGLELVRGVRRVDLDLPVILMSGKPDVESAARALEFGAFRYVTKPLNTDEIEKLVRQAIRANSLARVRRQAAAITGAQIGMSDRAGLEVRFETMLDSMWMAYQPIVHASTGDLFGVEALMRSREPSIPHPGAILDAATRLERLPQLGRRTRTLAGSAVAARPDIPSLFVNLHPADLLDADLISGSAALTAIASRVVLEVTEREDLEGSAALVERLERLRELGFRIAVDDIGAGYSGLTSFADLRPEIVKIDMSLIRSVHTSTVKQRTVSALVTLCHEVGTLVVAEGVETNEERDCLLGLECDLLQGFLIAKPSGTLPSVV